MACPGQGIELVIKSDVVFDQADVHLFYVQMNRQGRKGVVTITGLFQSDKDPLTPYVLDIQHVKDVAPRP
jgi:predicted ThiF/HesA family dinucleotide-utilizing enzyme